MKKIALFLFAVLLTAALTSANGSNQDEIAEGKAIVENGTSCSELSDEQLEAVGEYLMEQMHPNEAHEAMHEAMGMEEGTEQHNQIHISMAKAMYCGEGTMGCGAMMGNAGNSGMMGMMGSGMMGSSGNSNMQGGMMGMMSMMSMMSNMGSNTMGMMDNAEHNQMHSSMGDAGHNHMHGSTGSGMTGMMPMANNTGHDNWMQGMMQVPVGSLGIGHWNLLKAIYMMFIGA